MEKTETSQTTSEESDDNFSLQSSSDDDFNSLMEEEVEAENLATRLEDEHFQAGTHEDVRSGDDCMVKSTVAEPAQNPIWNATFDFPNVPGETLMEKTIEVTLWDHCPDRESVFLGECVVELQKAFLEDRPVWYRLEDPRGLRMGRKDNESTRARILQYGFETTAAYLIARAHARELARVS
ncbi:Uncharacterized protein GBIM_12832, partial [Gryllus bimaculatus]